MLSYTDVENYIKSAHTSSIIGLDTARILLAKVQIYKADTFYNPVDALADVGEDMYSHICALHGVCHD